MNTLILLAALASPTALPAPSAPSISAPEPAALARQEIDRDKFTKDFRRAMEVNARSEMEKIVRQQTETAKIHIIEVCEAIARSTNERLEGEISALQTAWDDAFDSKFATIMYEYHSLMRQQVRGFRNQKKEEFLKTEREYAKALESKNMEHLDAVLEKYEQLAEAFDNAGDHYYVGECWYRVGSGWDEGVRGKSKTDRKKAGEALRKAAAAREKIELKDAIYSSAHSRAEQLMGAERSERERVANDAAEGFTRRLAGVSLGAEAEVGLSFELLEDIDKVLRPGYGNVDLPTVWRSLSFTGQGSTTEFITLEKGPQAKRTGGSIELDVDRDGSADAEIPLTGNQEPVAFGIGAPDSPVKTGVLATVLTQSEVYQGITMPMQPSEAFLSLWIAPAGSMVGTVGETPIRIIDENLDGVYGSTPRRWNNLGLSGADMEPEFDTIVVGGAKRAQPFSEYIQIGAEWYQLTGGGETAKIKASPAKLETGKLRLKFKGTTPLYLIVKGEGTFANSYFDVMSNKKGIDVPAGSYKLFVGELRKGSRTQVMKALILPGKSTPAWSVNPGETTTIELGGPFDFDYAASTADAVVTVKGTSVAVIGKAGERYERLWNCGVKPEVFLRKAGTRKGGKGVKMERVRDSQTIIDEGFGVAWYPRDLEVEKKSGEEIELQLVEKKNKLFGTIESSWKPVN